jgi:hypothetical protein
MPSSFKESFHGNTTVIIDCFEIRTQTPGNLLTAAQGWSHYRRKRVPPNAGTKVDVRSGREM